MPPLAPKLPLGEHLSGSEADSGRGQRRCPSPYRNGSSNSLIRTGRDETWGYEVPASVPGVDLARYDASRYYKPEEIRAFNEVLRAEHIACLAKFKDTVQIPESHESLVHYHGLYSNASRQVETDSLSVGLNDAAHWYKCKSLVINLLRRSTLRHAGEFTIVIRVSTL